MSEVTCPKGCHFFDDGQWWLVLGEVAGGGRESRPLFDDEAHYCAASRVELGVDAEGDPTMKMMGEKLEAAPLGILVLSDETPEDWAVEIVTHIVKAYGDRIPMLMAPGETRFLPFRVYVASAEEALAYTELTAEIVAAAKAPRVQDDSPDNVQETL